jgi:exodeoxyribonuclease VII large subunit
MPDIITVSALNKYVRSLLESSEVLCDIAIRGEISNFTQNYKTRHCYFTLKDDKASLRAVMFAQNAASLKFVPQNGMQVLVRGIISLYERDGTFQINVDFMVKDGIGAQQLSFEMLKKKLYEEGLFDEKHKKPLPKWPKNIGVITSKSGAALQDVLNVAKRRCPMCTISLLPVQVQGENASTQIIAAIKILEDKTDIILITRGGGCSEDLEVFNNEDLARAAFACKTPIVSAIGHEIDYTILDFVSSLRAATPSAAMEIILPDAIFLLEEMQQKVINIQKNIQNKLFLCYNILGDKNKKLQANHPKKYVILQEMRVNSIKNDIIIGRKKYLEIAQKKYSSLASLTLSLNPAEILKRGYAIARINHAVINSVKNVENTNELDIQLSDGRLLCSIKEVYFEENYM